VRHPRRDHRDVAGPHGPELAVDLELELALEHDDDLLLLVDVDRRDGVGLERHEVGHRPLTHHRAEPQARHELDRVDVGHLHEPPRPCGDAAGLGAEVGFTAGAGHGRIRSPDGGPAQPTPPTASSPVGHRELATLPPENSPARRSVLLGRLVW